MKDDKRCPYCNRIFRGEGFKGHCTSECFAIEENAKLFGKRTGIADRIDIDHRKPNTNADDWIKKCNAKWLKSGKPEPKKLTGYKCQDKIAYRDTEPCMPSYMKKFKAIRG